MQLDERSVNHVAVLTLTGRLNHGDAQSLLHDKINSLLHPRVD